MTAPTVSSLSQLGDAFARALDARDARFDGVFFVGVTTTRIYCRPVCPSRISFRSHRRFFGSAAAAEREGFRPCLRCRPELAPGFAPVDAVPRLAFAAARLIAAGALNGHSVTDLARNLGVSERHLRRAVERELGVSPLALAQTHRLLLAKRLLADTSLSVTRIAYASGFQSLRRFNAAFRAQYRMAPKALGRAPQRESAGEFLRLTLAYRPPFAWGVLAGFLAHDAISGVETTEGVRYGRTVSIDGRRGVFFAQNATSPTKRAGRRSEAARTNVHQAWRNHLIVDVSPSLVPALMPLLARLRQLFDLDSDPLTIDDHLTQGGLGAFVARTPGIRLPGAFDGFEVAMRVILHGRLRCTIGVGTVPSTSDAASLVTRALGEPIETGVPGLSHLAPTSSRVAEAGGKRLRALGVPGGKADALVAVARLVEQGDLNLEPGSDVVATRRALMEIPGLGDQLATTIVMRALYWPDAFPLSSRAMARTAHGAGERAAGTLSELWRPWRAYATLHLGLSNDPH